MYDCMDAYVVLNDHVQSVSYTWWIKKQIFEVLDLKKDLSLKQV